LFDVSLKHMNFCDRGQCHRDNYWISGPGQCGWVQPRYRSPPSRNGKPLGLGPLWLFISAWSVLACAWANKGFPKTERIAVL